MIAEHVADEGLIRLACFISAFAAMAAWEALAPRRARDIPRSERWTANLGLMLTSSIAARLAFPLMPVAAAELAVYKGWGFFNAADWPRPLEFAAAFLALDLLIYLQHVLFHHLPLLWRLHRVHHADIEFDVTTGIRFHPLEILISTAIKVAAVTALGATPWSVLLFETVLNATSVFNHANGRMPEAADSVLRLLAVTPDMHRVHHGVLPHETNSNFGFSVPWWDRLFGTYRAEPELGQDGMTIGLTDFREPAERTWAGLLANPFKVAARPAPLPSGASASIPPNPPIEP